MQHTRRQRGAVLVVGLLILLVMTILGVTAMQTTVMEERMAGNMRDRSLAFQAAEAVLRDAEQLIENSVSTAAFNNSNENGLFGKNEDEPDKWASATWQDTVDNTASRAYDGPDDDTALDFPNTQPRYFVKHIGTVEGEGGSKNLKGYGSKPVGRDTEIFRITARGTGGNDNTEVIVQTHYGKIY